MKPIRFQTDRELQYNAKDAAEAVSAYPWGIKAEDYLDEMRACTAELQRRERVRLLRQDRATGFDPLTYPARDRRRLRHNNAFRAGAQVSATWTLGYMARQAR